MDIANRKALVFEALTLLLLLSLASTVFLNRLGDASLRGDEAIFAQVSSEAAFTGRWLPPTFDEKIFLAKPPLKMWLVAALFGQFGQDELVARLPDVVFGLLLLLLVYTFGRRYFGRGAAICSVLLLVVSHKFVFIHGLRDSVQDSLTVLLATIMLFSWLDTGVLSRNKAPSHLPVWLAAGALAFVKNPLGVFFAFLLLGHTVVEITIQRARFQEQLTRLIPVLGSALICAAAWILYLTVVTDGRYLSVLARDVIERATDGIDPTHVKAADYYLRSIYSDFGAWLLFLLPAGFRAWRGLGANASPRDVAGLHLVLWVVLIVAVFSLSVSKLPWYVYPAYPPLAILAGAGVSDAGTYIARVAGNGFRTALWSIVAIYLCGGLIATWRVSERDIQLLDMHRFSMAYRKTAGSTVSVPFDDLLQEGRFRSWNVFYLYWLPGIRWNHDGLDGSKDEECRYAVTSNTDRYLARGWEQVLKVRMIDNKAVPLHVVGTCPLILPPPIWTHPPLDRNDWYEVKRALRDWTGLEYL